MTEVNERTSGHWRFANASLYGDQSKYVMVHRDSDMGDPNYADRVGYEFVCYTPEGLLVYRRKTRSILKFIHRTWAFK